MRNRVPLDRNLQDDSALHRRARQTNCDVLFLYSGDTEPGVYFLAASLIYAIVASGVSAICVNFREIISPAVGSYESTTNRPRAFSIITSSYG